MTNKNFNKALNNFITDFAEGGAIRHMADKGLSVSEIKEQLDFPLPQERIAQIVWDHYVNTGIICLQSPDKNIEKVSYVKDTNQYGSTSLRRVVEPVDTSDVQYIPVNFGKYIYQNKDEFIKSLSELSQNDLHYILDLPWPLTTVYHIYDERMQRLIDANIFKYDTN